MTETTTPNDDELLAILDGTVKEVAAQLPDRTDDELAMLKFAEEAGNTRKGVIEAIDAEMQKRTAEQLAALESAQPSRSVDEIQADIDALESQAIDIHAAERLHALRAELAEQE